ncbi:hypothetical protein GCM10017556_04740 [Micromonospora sagamiensis]|nr:hypothetical protein GCM10017556_04740 [Micromonospora sagamiensis]
MTADQIQTKAYAGSVGRPIVNQPATNRALQIDMATTRGRPPSGDDTGGPDGAGGWGSVTTAITVQVNGGQRIDERRPALRWSA